MDINSIEKKLNITPNGYVGSKKNKISWINSCFQNEGIDLKNSTVFDAFSGTGSFSIYSKLIGAKKIFSNDFLISSALYVKTFVENPGLKLSEEEIKYLIYNKNRKTDSFMQKYYTGEEKYFHEKESIFLDNFKVNIEDLDGNIKINMQDIFYLRKNRININDDQIFKIGYKQAAAFAAILSMISSWFGGGAGKFSSPSYKSRKIFTVSREKAKRKDRPFIGEELVLDYLKYSKSSLDKINRCIEPIETNALTFNTDTMSLLQTKAFVNNPIDLIYIDLPYGGEHTDYFKLYGLLESYVLSKPILQLNYLNEINYFNSKIEYEKSFIKLLELLKFNKISTWIFSFNDSSWTSVNRIINILKAFTNRVKVYNAEHSYKYRRGTNRNGTEYLFICK
ncbi:hypothetical protein AUJ66_08600 [Candidatus Desantisbacteria bacterium CG1_02_38_46]|uniref:Uncharacterized protein n=3 Tax=unclassified Candidatus Desantisiibacteriota TaxID=3106372 RepID=A0A2H9PB08_9BACT|nr:MAG: hypothetical protein AUJ66_08600 [Candidatus Desantisbacteria bacterium CG1_02_38_46]PIU51966.1 MAG: hypothetical protein COS91_01705 [Candidatus Desantisbacteria bacterium CG07_land_8_20_14_0_80_39_15]PIZ15846.1 MAG: hypothetical protein COY51_04200 [Candidatus Desantisbacteria bacterium CG_4_10_14_0_8_um_filter_39_17]